MCLKDDGVVIKGINKKGIEFHPYQACEEIINLRRTCRKRVRAKGSVSLNRLDTLNEIKKCLLNIYDLIDTIIIGNAHGGAGDVKKDFNKRVG